MTLDAVAARRRRFVIPLLAGVLGTGLLAPSAASAAAVTDRPLPDPVSALASGHGLGMQKSNAWITPSAKAGTLRAASSLPDSADLSEWAVPVGNQGSVGSCVAWSVGYAMTGLYANMTDKGGAPFAPMYMYSQIHLSNTADGGGAYTSDAYDLLEEQGIAPKADYSGDDYVFTNSPTDAERAAALPYQTVDHTYLFSGAGQSTSATAVKTALADGKPVLIGLPVYSAFDELDDADQVVEASEVVPSSFRGNHAVLAVGYDSTGIQVQNSWGTNWGVDGFGTLADDFVNSYVFEGSTMEVWANSGDTDGSFTVVGSSRQPATGNSALLLDSTVDLGANATAFRNAKFTAVIGGTRTVTPTWVSSSRLRLALPAGSGGTDTTVEIRRDGTTVGSVTISYLGKISGATWRTDRSTGVRTGTISGAGLSRTQDWTLTSVTDEDASIEVPAVDSQSDLDATDTGIYVASDTRAFVKLPADVPGAAGSWRLSFNPVSGAYFAELARETLLDVKYVAPKVTGLSAAGVSTAGGDLVVRGTDLTAVDPDLESAVVLRPVSGAGSDVEAAVTSVTASTIGITVPALAAGDYRVVLTTGMGESADAGTRDKVEAVVAAGGTSSVSQILAAGGKVVLTTSGLGDSASAMRAAKVGVRVGAKTLPVRWLSSTTVQVTVPAGTPGEDVELVIVRKGVESEPIAVEYVAGITAAKASVLPTTGGEVRLTGVGLVGTWVLHPIAAGDSTDDDVALTPTSTDSRGRTVTLDLPASAEGAYRLVLTPSQSTYPGAAAVFTGASVISFSDFG